MWCYRASFGVSMDASAEPLQRVRHREPFINSY